MSCIDQDTREEIQRAHDNGTPSESKHGRTLHNPTNTPFDLFDGRSTGRGFMTPSKIETIRNLRGFGVAWAVIARRLQTTIAECRAAIGLPVYQKGERAPLPWDVTQQTLPFDK